MSTLGRRVSKLEGRRRRPGDWSAMSDAELAAHARDLCALAICDDPDGETVRLVRSLAASFDVQTEGDDEPIATIWPRLDAALKAHAAGVKASWAGWQEAAVERLR